VRRILSFAILLAAFTVFPKAPHAQDLAAAGTCWKTSGQKTACLRLSASVLLLQYDFDRGKFAGGITPAGGYGFSLTSSDPKKPWLEGSFDLYLGAKFGQSADDGSSIPDNVTLVGVFTFMDVFKLGLGSTWVNQLVGAAKAHLSLFFGLGSSFGEAHNKAAIDEPETKW
jgi:hypothetical protein